MAGSRVRWSVGVALALLAALAPAASAGPWEDLRRPVDLPELAPGEACPISPVDERVDWDQIGIFGGSGIGPGPAYPGLGGQGGVLGMEEEWFNGSRYETKVFWYVKPSYPGPVLVRGRRLDGPGTLRFSDWPRRDSPELRIARHSDIEWSGQPPGSRGEPSGVKAPAAGCYGVQMDGTRFSRPVVFAVTVE